MGDAHLVTVFEAVHHVPEDHPTFGLCQFFSIWLPTKVAAQIRRAILENQMVRERSVKPVGFYQLADVWVSQRTESFNLRFNQLCRLALFYKK